ncbi:MAG: M24 family metallopeptidase, partial [Kiritimatiellae bacterium]|nr:M24 family metallopeptidase [Kiritimatiellia bacterium]
PEEIRAIRASQAAARAAERALGAAIRRCGTNRRGELVLDGAAFTSERARALVRATLLMRGTMDFEGSIVAGGAQAADPHEQGHGPLRDGELVVADIFPRSLATGYWGDMTRTFHHGRLPPERRRLLKTVAAAQKLGLSLVKPGSTGKAVHEAVAEFFERAGYRGWTGADGTPRGFFHGLGHGVGLEIHEEPRLSPSGLGTLRPGMVVTVEPGLYYPDVGGARIEDTVLVTETGCEIL